MDVLKNYKILKETHLGFNKVSIRYEDTEVFLGLPIGIVPFGEVLDDLYLIGNNSGFGVFAKKESLPEVLEQIKKQQSENKELLENEKVFFLKRNGENLEEVKEEEAEFKKVLPKETDVSKLTVFNNEIVLREEL